MFQEDIKHEDNYFKLKNIMASVPQGSILDPLL